MTVDRSGKLKQWSVVQGWRALVDEYNAGSSQDARPHRRTNFSGLAVHVPAKVHHLQQVWQSI